MSVGSVGQSTSAYWYLQSLLQQQTANAGGPTDPVTALLSAFYPSGGGDQASGGSSSPPPAAPPNVSLLSPDTLGAIIAMQSQQSDAGNRVAARAQVVFSEFDTNNDGQISKSEFESAFGSGADMSKVDGLFNALDADGDGAISQAELTAAAQEAYAHHHHHHMHGAQGSGGGDGGGGGGGGLSALLSSTDLSGATTQSTSNSDGSTTTTITYGDGSTVTMTTPAASPDGSGAPAKGDATSNFIEKLISWQAQFLAASSSTPPDVG